jgi:intracellular multiplication protein IcmB
MDALIHYMHSALFKTNPRDFVDLVTTDDDHTFVTKEGSLVTVLRLKGITSKLYDDEMREVIEEVSGIIGKNLIAGGVHGFSISFEFDPDEAYNYALRALQGSHQTAKRLGLGDLMESVFEEKASKMAEFCQVENCYVAITTTAAAIHKQDMKDQVRERNEKMMSWPDTADAMLQDFAFPQLRTRHSTAVKSFVSDLRNLESLKDVGLMFDVLSVRQYLKDIRRLTSPGSSPRWQPRIAKDTFRDVRVPARPSQTKGDRLDGVMPPPIGHQLFSSTPTTLGLQYAVMGDRIYYPTALSLGPTDPETFDRLINQAAELRLPFRISFSMKGSGTGVDLLNTILAKTFNWMSTRNSLRKDAYEGLQDYEDKRGGVVPAMYVTACTWADAKPRYSKKQGVMYDLTEIAERATKLNRALQGWGGCQTQDTFAAPIEGVLTTQAGACDKPMGAVMAPTMPDAIGLTPLFRPTTSWGQRDGNVLLRSSDGRFLHYQQTSSHQTAWVTLLVGPMGFSKSTTMNTLNLFYLLTPSPESEMPMLRCLDVGPSSRSIIDLVRSSLPSGQEDMAQYIRLTNTKDCQFNPFDTPMGLEFPLPNHRDYLTNLISTICYAMAKDSNLASRLPGMVATIISATYKAYASRENGGDRARVYYENANPLVDQKIREHGIAIDEVTTWHEVRNELYDVGEVKAATACHRKAMPVLADLIAVASSEEIRSDYPDEIGGARVLDLFSRSIREAVEIFPILQGETKFDLGEARVISLDMEDLVPKEQTERALWQASIAFFLGYDILTRDFFFHRDYLKYVPKRYGVFHTRRVKRMETARKRFSMDERQRFSKVPAAQSQVDSLIAEGRKNLVDIQVASQLFEDHTEKSINLASTIVILGAGNMDKNQAAMVQDRFSLTPSQMMAIRRIRGPGPKGAEAFMIFRTKDGSQSHHVMLSEGSIYLWLIATEAVDRGVRQLMYERFQPAEALRRLAKRFPGGSIKKELENRLADMADEGADDQASARMIEELADECSQ